MTLWAGIEVGGTKVVCALGKGPENIIAETTIETRSPKETLNHVIGFFKNQQEQFGPVKSIGIGTFGPVDLDPDSPTHGYITTTPKQDWTHTNLVGMLKEEFHVPVGIDTDVNAAALAENLWGAAKGLETFIYLTIGTGIGGGGMINGKLVHGLLHPEMGHILIPHNKVDDPFPGICPFHGDCLEGLACGPAIEKRWGVNPNELPPEHRAWELEARYLAMGLVNYICTLSPQRIIMGGGVMQQPQLFSLIRKNVSALLNSYLNLPAILYHIDDYIIPPELSKKAGVLGALALAMEAFKDKIINP